MNFSTTILENHLRRAQGAPQSEDETARQQPRASPDTSRVRKSILLADDDPGVRETLGRVLVSEHYEVVFAKTGRQTAARVLSDPPDLVLLDLNMPDKDGWEAFGEICEKHPMIPVIVITARPDQQARAVGLGIDALMEKPLNLQLLLATIRNLLAETEPERVRRLTNPGFQTVFLSDSTNSPANERNR
jgi:DNA-binding response OmpR family regulator